VLRNLLLTVGLVAAILIAAALVRWITRATPFGGSATRARFWIAQATHLAVLAGIIVVLLSIWAPAAGGIGPVFGWAAAGLTIALQRVVTAFAGYLIILRGNVFTVGDRIMIGGVRGDVVGLGFMQTTVMEMGQTPSEMHDDPSMWIRGRQYSGRIVRVTNDKLFDEPIYNYTRDFPFVWEEILIPVRFEDDYRVVERLMLETARRHTADAMRDGARALEQVRDKYFLSESPSVEPRVYLRITDNWNELSVRFLIVAHTARTVKDAMSRDLIAGLREAGIGVASATNAIVEVPPINVRMIG
jgi:small-conductance mechanosensitive channel